jgi:tRNA1Val (adenine37-N6)-methyltransferase
MRDTVFHFKQFIIHQDKCAMKVGTDAVLLGSWIKPADNAKRILDVGTGSGVIALMLAQKCEAFIDAVDIDRDAFLQAKENFLLSPWFRRLNAVHQSFQEFAARVQVSYDLIVSNPPYFLQASKPSAASRTNARHREILAFHELLDGVTKLLHRNGSFCVILPGKEGMDFLDHAQRKGLFCNHLVRIKTKPCKEEKRLIMQFGFQYGMLTEEEIIIQDEDGHFTQDYCELTRDYYLQLKQSTPYFPQS